MGAELVRTFDIYQVISRAMGAMNARLLNHGEIVGYIFYNMLKVEGKYSDTELAEWALIGMLHDVGAIKTNMNNASLATIETTNVWAHSIYGYLFLRYLSPVGDKAEVVLYHHLPYKLHEQINSRYIREAQYLTIADKMDLFARAEGHNMPRDYFSTQGDIDFAQKALERFYVAQKRFHVLDKLKTGEYKQEMSALFKSAAFTEQQKKGFLEMLVYSIDFRSQQTVIHTMSTKAFSLEIGKLMNVGTRDLEILYYGSLLHDIGKIVIPLSILEAPRRLTDEEMRIMKAHVVITGKILEGIMDERIVNVADRHHEKLDGTGYPQGLRAEDLSQLERIVAVGDILSALYSKRSYKDSFPPEKIKGILKDDADNGKISKEIVDVELKKFDDIISRYEKQRNLTMERYMEITARYDSIYEKFKAFDA